jgi:hypothetical protein
LLKSIRNMAEILKAIPAERVYPSLTISGRR